MKEKGFVVLSDIIPEIILDIRYYSAFNFVGERIDGYDLPLAIVTIEAAKALKKVNDELLQNDCCLKVYDAYRPERAVRHFMKWARNDDIRMKEYFYPDLDKKDLIPLGYIAEKSAHSRGSTIDLTIFDLKRQRELNMGGSFDYFGDISHSDYEELGEEELNNRKYLKELMFKYGFVGIKEEWWHFTLKDEPYRDTYFDFVIGD